jgi:hypothetical protein
MKIKNIVEFICAAIFFAIFWGLLVSRHGIYEAIITGILFASLMATLKWLLHSCDEEK